MGPPGVGIAGAWAVVCVRPVRGVPGGGCDRDAVPAEALPRPSVGNGLALMEAESVAAAGLVLGLSVRLPILSSMTGSGNLG